MFVIRSRAGESFLIDCDIEVEVLEISSSQVKLGIVAPRNISILRKEVHITRQQNQAASREISPQELAIVAGKLHPPR
jgi:carbon storage regulator